MIRNTIANMYLVIILREIWRARDTCFIQSCVKRLVDFNVADTHNLVGAIKTESWMDVGKDQEFKDILRYIASAGQPQQQKTLSQK